MSTSLHSKILIVGENSISNQLFQKFEHNNIDVKGYRKLTEKIVEDFDLVFIDSEDDIIIKLNQINFLNQFTKDNAIICLNIEAINLKIIQNNLNSYNGNIFGVNFNHPFTPSKFMEIIITDVNQQTYLDKLLEVGKNVLDKDPYVVNQGISARAYMLAAMTREAFFLVDNGYANVESVDRACRNDAGYYMPFTGNFLYMDLMGTVAYALVMRDLNPELSKCQDLPNWFIEKVKMGKSGMKTLNGFYLYENGDLEKWELIISEFSKDVNKLIKKYDQKYLERMYHE
ncbi:3-hydroxyacyl-CoA dehydrogenase family protein [Sphingobacterium daejeonense]|uniref:3-hydroxyacyl-CoA dehydrogenase family protein n=1 Tax=Sphingobacterium daejeonense TaxID=371142 RepID=UPI0021A7DA9C|nr:3-hydroxyacyl-CoA dehydrogenase family protein [Sphingobacterium daejeonense]MCT1530124.1 3-hydroxyacyl-CoA dehydrogenase family protein [Sphingobacterium daejeonense]